ncbi:hypothetical protein D3C85_1056450 [compost metagenome]
MAKNLPSAPPAPRECRVARGQPDQAGSLGIGQLGIGPPRVGQATWGQAASSRAMRSGGKRREKTLPLPGSLVMSNSAS